MVLGALTHTAEANTIALTLDGCLAGCTTPPYATVSLTQDGNGVDLLITLGSDGTAYRVHGAEDTNHFALAFDLAGDPAITVTDPNNFFSPAGPFPGSFVPTPWGTFDYALICTGCGKGYSGGVTPTLPITITPTSGTITPSDFVTNPDGHFFTIDIVDSGGNFGNAADPVVPEPVTLLLTGTALVAMALGIRKRIRRK